MTKWHAVSSEQVRRTGSYVFTASAAGYTCAQNVGWPVITVTVEETLYCFDQNTGALSAVSGGVYPVDANGNVTIDIPAGTRAGAKETYVLLPAQETAGIGTGTTHTIRKGGTWNQISEQYGCRVEDLLALNPGVDIYNLRIGSELIVPAR